MTIRAGIKIRILHQAVDAPAILVNMLTHARIIVVVLCATVDAIAILISMAVAEAPRHAVGGGADRSFGCIFQCSRCGCGAIAFSAMDASAIFIEMVAPVTGFQSTCGRASRGFCGVA